MKVTLRPFEPPHLALLKQWLSRAHVQPWYPNPERDMGIAIHPPTGCFHAIVAVDSAPIGYVRWQYVDRSTLDELGLRQIPENSVDIDILLGDEAQTAKGAGPQALETLARQLRSDPSVPMLGLTTSVQNARAHSAFAKAGFSTLLQYIPQGYGPCYLMVRDLQQERRRAGVALLPAGGGAQC